jgi:hypothetical protein
MCLFMAFNTYVFTRPTNEISDGKCENYALKI